MSCVMHMPRCVQWAGVPDKNKILPIIPKNKKDRIYNIEAELFPKRRAFLFGFAAHLPFPHLLPADPLCSSHADPSMLPHQTLTIPTRCEENLSALLVFITLFPISNTQTTSPETCPAFEYGASVLFPVRDSPRSPEC